jgi:hypothetical protein
MCESALGLYRYLNERSIVESLDCTIWYQGAFGEIVQLFSCHPIIKIPVVKPFLIDASSIGPDVQTLQHIRLGKNAGFENLRPMADFLGSKVPFVLKEEGITIIRRVKKREYLQTDDLAVQLKTLNVPVRIAQLETMPFATQVNLMRNTRILIAPHGAGTLNQIFMPAGGKIVELFPKGYSNWHATAVAKVFGHELIEVESDKPAAFGRKPTKELRRFIEKQGWPDRAMVQASRKKSEDLLRIVRDVSSYSIDPARIVHAVNQWPVSRLIKSRNQDKIHFD